MLCGKGRRDVGTGFRLVGDGPFAKLTPLVPYLSEEALGFAGIERRCRQFGLSFQLVDFLRDVLGNARDASAKLRRLGFRCDEGSFPSLGRHMLLQQQAEQIGHCVAIVAVLLFQAGDLALKIGPGVGVIGPFQEFVDVPA